MAVADQRVCRATERVLVLGCNDNNFNINANDNNRSARGMASSPLQDFK
ncbi:MAG: hypothetical protein HY363_05755 [Candidatus Aenigmarchaeota archaeon]|nr:hypothetical protein [Candidatus Aenigmarchaeota archaeon]